MKQFSTLSAISICLLLSMLLCRSALAQMPDQQCRDRAFYLSQVDAVEKVALQLERSVEGVPPADAEYIRRESRAALDQKNSQRYSIIAHSRYYMALQFHDDIKVVLDNIAAAKSASTSKQTATFLSVVVSRLGDLKSSLSDYMEADAKRSPSVLKKDDRSGLYFSIAVVRSSALNLLQCVLGSI